MTRLAQLWRDWMESLVWLWCIATQHKLTVPHQNRIVEANGQIGRLDTWTTCRCGMKAGGHTSTRTIRPYPPRGNVR